MPISILFSVHLLINCPAESQDDLRREHPTTLSRHPPDVSNSADEDPDEYEGDAEFGSEDEVSSSDYEMADNGLDERSEISDLTDLSGVSWFSAFEGEAETEDKQEGDSFFEFGSEAILLSDSDSDDSDSDELESDDEEQVGGDKDNEGDACYRSAYAVEPDQSDISDDAIDSALGRDFVMDMREALASSVTVRRELPDDVEMEDVGFETPAFSTVPGEEAVPVPASQQSSCSPDDAVLATIMPGLPGRASSLPACQGPPPGDRTQEQERESVRYLLEFARAHPGNWEVLLGLYLQEVVRPRALTGRGGVIGWEGNRRGVWVPNPLLPIQRQFQPGSVPGPYSCPQGPDGFFLQSMAAQIMQNEDLYRAAVDIWADGLTVAEEPALKHLLARAGWCSEA